MSKIVNAAELDEKIATLLDEMAETREEVVITRDGRAVARLVPIRPLRGSVKILGDIVEPIDVEWDATK